MCIMSRLTVAHEGCEGCSGEENRYPMVEHISEGSAAHVDGRIMSGDYIMSIDSSGSGHNHVSTQGMTLEDVAALVLGPRSTSVEFHVQRAGTKKDREGHESMSRDGPRERPVAEIVKLRRGKPDDKDIEIVKQRYANEELTEANHALVEALQSMSAELEMRREQLESERRELNTRLAETEKLVSEQTRALEENRQLLALQKNSLVASERAAADHESEIKQLKSSLHEVCTVCLKEILCVRCELAVHNLIGDRCLSLHMFESTFDT